MLSDRINYVLDGIYALVFKAFGLRVVKDEGVANKTPEVLKALIRIAPEYKALVTICGEEIDTPEKIEEYLALIVAAPKMKEALEKIISAGHIVIAHNIARKALPQPRPIDESEGEDA